MSLVGSFGVSVVPSQVFFLFLFHVFYITTCRELASKRVKDVS